MKSRFDIYLGVAAWIVGLLAVYAASNSKVPYGFEICEWVVPVLWICTVVVIFTFTKRPARKLWWVWLSAPLAFVFWVFFIASLMGHQGAGYGR